MTNSAQQQNEYRKLPSVEALLQRAAVTDAAPDAAPDATTAAATPWPANREAVAEAARDLLAQARAAIALGAAAPADGWWAGALAERLKQAARPSLRRVINATGVILHTNLGRAPLSRAALDAMVEAARGYSNLEYDLEEGARGSRHDHARALLGRLTGAEDALVVNNNAAAVWLMLAALCSGREVLISRGQLVEIGGGFRIPDVLRQSGALLVEVGTTNRTHLRDFAAAMTPATAAILTVFAGNFRQTGYVSMPQTAELAALAQTRPADSPLLLLADLGSGALADTEALGLASEPTPVATLRAGADVVTFSGDKLVGGPQAGLVVGRAPLVEQMRRHPLARALRVDKLTLAALDATLRTWATGRAPVELPVWRMLAAAPDELLARAARWQALLHAAGRDAEVLAGESTIGGGSLPGETLPTWLLALPASGATAELLAAYLRSATPPVICRIAHGHLLFDPRTVAADEEADLLAALLGAPTADSRARQAKRDG